MLFGSAAPTPYDLRFMLFGFPIRIHPGFWVVAVLLGMNLPPRYVPIWVAAVLVSILVHELGHAVVQRWFGGRPQIVLYTFGGVAAAEGVDRSPWRNILVSLAGPGAGFIFFGVLYAATQFFGEPTNLNAKIAIIFLLEINFFWGVINLSPILPLDGGHVARELLMLFLKPSKGMVASLWLSIFASVVIGLFLFQITKSTWNLMLFGMLGYQSYEALVAYRRSRGAW